MPIECFNDDGSVKWEFSPEEIDEIFERNGVVATKTQVRLVFGQGEVTYPNVATNAFVENEYKNDRRQLKRFGFKFAFPETD